MHIEQGIELDLRGSVLPGRTCTPKLVIFMTKQNSLKENLRVDYYYLLPKYCGGNVSYFPYLGQINCKV